MDKQSRSDKIKILSEKLKNLSEEEQNIFIQKHGIKTVEGRTLSRRNQLLISLQLDEFSIVGGFHQWRKAGRKVKKGEHGALILFPVGEKDNDGNIENASKFYSAVVFDVSQTTELEQIKEAV